MQGVFIFCLFVCLFVTCYCPRWLLHHGQFDGFPRGSPGATVTYWSFVPVEILQTLPQQESPSSQSGFRTLSIWPPCGTVLTGGMHVNLTESYFSVQTNVVCLFDYSWYISSLINVSHCMFWRFCLEPPHSFALLWGTNGRHSSGFSCGISFLTFRFVREVVGGCSDRLKLPGRLASRKPRGSSSSWEFACPVHACSTRDLGFPSPPKPHHSVRSCRYETQVVEP